MLKNVARWMMARRGIWVLAGAILAGCSGSGEDVRVSLCKDLASTLAQTSETLGWRDMRVEMRRAEELAVHLDFDARDPAAGQVKPMRIACYYRHDAVDDTALTLADPMAAYSTSPYSVILNGEAITNPRLARAIKSAMLKQGRELLGRVRGGVENAARAAQERLGGGAGPVDKP